MEKKPIPAPIALAVMIDYLKQLPSGSIFPTIVSSPLKEISEPCSLGTHLALAVGEMRRSVDGKGFRCLEIDGIDYLVNATGMSKDELNAIWQTTTGKKGEFWHCDDCTDAVYFITNVLRGLGDMDPLGKRVLEKRFSKSGVKTEGRDAQRDDEKPCSCDGGRSDHNPGCLFYPDAGEREAARREIRMMAGKAREIIENMAEVAGRATAASPACFKREMTLHTSNAITALEGSLCASIPSE